MNIYSMFFCFRMRSAFEIIFRKSATLQDVTPDVETGSIGTPSIGSPDMPPISPSISKKVQLVSVTQSTI